MSSPLTAPLSRVNLREMAVVTFAFGALTVLYLGMTWTRFISAIPPDAGDPLFNLAILRWTASQLTGAPGELWSPPFFFPLRGVLALSDHLIAPAAAVAAMDAAGLPPAATYNALLVAAFALSGASAHWVFRRGGLSPAGAALGAIAWTFSTFRWSALSHLQVLLALWIPVALWTFYRLLAAPSPRRALRFLVFYLLQLLSGVYLALMLHFALAAIAAVRHRQIRSAWGDPAARRSLLGAAAVAVAASAWLFSHYALLGRELGLGSHLGQILQLRVTLASYLTVGARTIYADFWPERLVSEFPLWPGAVTLSMLAFAAYRRAPLAALRALTARSRRAFVAVALAALAFALRGEYLLSKLAQDMDHDLRIQVALCAVAFVVLLAVAFRTQRKEAEPVRPQEPDEMRWCRSLAAVGVISAVASYGPVFVTLREMVPGLDAVRVPTRFFAFTGFALAAFAGSGLDRLRTTLSRRGKSVVIIATGVVLILAVVESIPRSRFTAWAAAPDLPDAPPVYRWLAMHDEARAVVELPMPFAWREATRLYFATLHHRPIFNGYSSTLPPSYVALRERLLDFPDRAVTAELARLDLTHMVIHLDQLSRRDRKAWERWQADIERDPAPWLTKLGEEGAAAIYRIEPATGPPAAAVDATPSPAPPSGVGTPASKRWH